MKICIDPGHGMGNRRLGIFDPGAVHREEYALYREASIVLTYGLMLESELLARGAQVVMTRRDAATDTHLNSRARLAETEKADMLISLHMNDFDSDTANGVEVLFGNWDSKSLAHSLSENIAAAADLRNRGPKLRNELSVLRFRGLAALIELGFIANDHDRGQLLNVATRAEVIDAIATTILTFAPERNQDVTGSSVENQSLAPKIGGRHTDPR